MPRREKTLVLSRPRQIAAVTAPLRQEVIVSLGEEGSASAAELAQRLGRSCHTLYYHLRLLAEAGVVRISDYRKTGGREVAVYSLTAMRIEIAPSPTSSRGVLAAQRTASAVLQSTIRDVIAAIADGSARRKGQGRELYALRGRARLNNREIGQINRLVDEIEGVLRNARRERGEGTMYAVTVALTPVKESR